MARDLFEFFQAQREEQNEDAAPSRKPTLLENFFSGKVVKEGDEWDDLIADLGKMGITLEPEKEKKKDGEKRKPGRPAKSAAPAPKAASKPKPKAAPLPPADPRGVIDQMPAFDLAGEYTPEEFSQAMPQQAAEFETDVGSKDGMFLVNADGRAYFVPNEGAEIMSYLDGKGWIEADPDDLGASNDLAADRYQAIRSQPTIWGDERFKAEDPGGWTDDNASTLAAAMDSRSGGLDVSYNFGDAPKSKSQNVGMDELDLDALIANMEAGGMDAVDPNYKPPTPAQPKLMAKAPPAPAPKAQDFSAEAEWNTDDPEFNEFMKGLDFGKK